ncbi:MAG: vWA domain-containing protein, partial [bacterium]
MFKRKLLYLIFFFLLGLTTIISIGYLNRDQKEIGCGKVQATNDIGCPFDVILILDTSNSMADTANGKSKLTWVKEAANNFVDYVSNSNQASSIRIGIIAFNSGAPVYSAPTNNYNNVRATIAGITKATGGTCTSCALIRAHTLYSSLLPQPNNPIIIIFSDGGSTGTYEYPDAGCGPNTHPTCTQIHNTAIAEDNVWTNKLLNMSPKVNIYAIGMESNCPSSTPSFLCYDQAHLIELTGGVLSHFYDQIAAPQWAEKVIEITQKSEFCVAQPSPTPTSIPTP